MVTIFPNRPDSIFCTAAETIYRRNSPTGGGLHEGRVDTVMRFFIIRHRFFNTFDDFGSFDRFDRFSRFDDFSFRRHFFDSCDDSFDE